MQFEMRDFLFLDRRVLTVNGDANADECAYNDLYPIYIDCCFGPSLLTVSDCEDVQCCASKRFLDLPRLT